MAPTDNEEFARPFADFLTEQSRTHTELTDGLHDVIAAVTETGKGGSITLTIKVDPDKKADGVYRITDAVTVKAPTHDRPSRIYYRDKAGNLSRSDPHQPVLEGLRVIENKVTTELKEAK